MNPNPTRSPRLRRAWLMLAALAPLTLGAGQPQTIAADGLTISAAWARATAPGSTVGAVYFTIENRAARQDALLHASSPVATEATFHHTTRKDGVARMEQLRTVDLAAGSTVKFEPLGRHLMLSGLRQPLAAGTLVPVTLQFQHAGPVTLQVQIVPITAAGPEAATDPLMSTHPHKTH